MLILIDSVRSFQLNPAKLNRANRASSSLYTTSISRSDVKVTKEPTVWEVFGGLAQETQAVNLGQGFPDWDPPQFVLDSLRATIDTPFHQYTRPAGHPALVELLAERYSKHMNLGRDIDAMNEVAVTVGASQALYLALRTIVQPDDEVLVFDPFFELYRKQINLVGGNMKEVALGGNSATSDDPWALNIDALEKAITSETKVLILNSPHNPTGKVFTRLELEAIAAVVRKHPQLIVLSDEVYKFTIYAPNHEGDPTVSGHSHFAAIPDMWDKTITISSCGKTFSVTGWQTGWMVGPEDLIQPVHEMLPCVQFCTATPTQQALTGVLKIADQPYNGYDNYYEWLRTQFIGKRKILEDGLISCGIEPLPAQGGVFLMARLPTNDPIVLSSQTGGTGTGNEPYDWKYCRMLAHTKGVIGIPASPFFSGSHDSETQPMARFAFCKRDGTLLEAASRLAKN